MSKPENCIRRRITVDGENVYVLVGKDFTQVTGQFENRRNKKPMSIKGAQKINETIIAVYDEFFGE